MTFLNVKVNQFEIGLQLSFLPHDISRIQLSRGVSCVAFFLRTFLKKLRFLSDQKVPGCHKNIYRDLEHPLQDLKFLATYVAFLGNKRNTCCHRRGREVQGGPCGILWKKSFFTFRSEKSFFGVQWPYKYSWR